MLRTALSNRLAKVQGFLFRAAFLRRVPLFFRLISENILLCFLASTMHSTSKYITGTLSLRFRKILTQRIHSHYFEVVVFKFFYYWCKNTKSYLLFGSVLYTVLCFFLLLELLSLYIFFQMVMFLYTQWMDSLIFFQIIL